MTLWIVLTLMTSAAAVLVSAPFIRGWDAGNRRKRGIEVYRDQLREVERDLEAGLIDADQAQAASYEIKRRMLAVQPAASEQTPHPISPNIAVVGVAGFVVLGSVALYGIDGRPGLQAASPSARGSAKIDIADAARFQGPIAQSAETANQTSGLGTVDEMIARLAARLSRKSDDPEGWRMLGWSYFHTDRYTEAAAAYAKAAALQPGVASFQSSYGEALVRAANETVTPEAKTLFERALKLDPKDAKARFYLGLALEKAGEKPAALEAWVALLKDATTGDEWVPDLKVRIASLASEIKVSLDPSLHIGAAATSARDVPTPTPAQIDAAQAMPEQDQNVMIHQMVDRLAARLAQSPQDREGWIRLMKSRKVLGEMEPAKDALRQALLTFPDAGPDRDEILGAARELGLAE